MVIGVVCPEAENVPWRWTAVRGALMRWTNFLRWMLASWEMGDEEKEEGERRKRVKMESWEIARAIVGG